jgi:hypothetical protein
MTIKMNKFVYFLTAIVFGFSIIAAAIGPENMYVKLGEKNWIDSKNYFICNFDHKPKKGNAILVIRVYKQNGQRSRDYIISGKTGMADMKMHDSEETQLKLNKTGDYLLPVNIVMAGAWEVTISIKNKVGYVYHEVIKFDVK